MATLSSSIVKHGVASMRDVEEALARQVLHGGDLLTNLVEVATVDESALARLLAEAHALPAGPAGELPPPRPEVLRLVPEELASRQGLFPLEERDGELEIAVAEPLPPEVEQDLGFLLGARVSQRVCPPMRVRQAIAREYGVRLDRRTLRVLARLEGRADPSPSSLPARRGSGELPAIPRAAPVPLELPELTRAPSGSPAAPAGAAPAPSASSAARAPGTSPASAETRPDPAPAADAAQPPTAGAAPLPRLPISMPPLGEPAPAALAGPNRKPTYSGLPGGAASTPPRETASPSLVRWLRARATPEPSPGRRFGPYTAAMAEQDLGTATGRDEVLRAFFDFSVQYFEYSALFAVQGDLAEGRDASGPGADRARVAGVGVPLDLPSSLATARAEGTLQLVRLATPGIDSNLARDLERRSDRLVLLLPVMMRGRCVLLLYGDHGDRNVELGRVGEVIALASLVGPALESAIVRKKLAARRALAQDGVDDSRTQEEQAAALRAAPGLGPLPAGVRRKRSLTPTAEARAAALRAFLEPLQERQAALDAGATAASPAPRVPTAAPSAPAATASPAPPSPPSRAPSEPVPRVDPRREPESPHAPPGTPPGGGPGARLPGFSAQPTPPPGVVLARIETLAVRAPGPRTSEAADAIPLLRRPPVSSPRPAVDDLDDWPDPASTRVVSRPPERALEPAVVPRPVIGVGARAEPRSAPLDGPTPIVAAPVAAAFGTPAPTPAHPVASGPPSSRSSGKLLLVPETVLDDDGPDIAVGAADLDPDLLAELGDGTEAPDEPPSSRAMSVSARPAPPRHSSAEMKLPSVIVDVSSDCRALVERVLEGDTAAGERLLEMGEPAASALVAAFPGPIAATARRGASGPSRASEAGPILSILARFGTRAVPYLAVRASDPSPVVRAWAARLLGELPCDESALAVARRLQDRDPEVRRSALHSGRDLRSQADSRTALRDALTSVAVDEAQPEDARHSAIESLADLREERAVGRLARALDSRSRDVARSAHWALQVLTRHDLGRDASRWLEWWDSHSEQHRIEWLIEALMEENPELRREAGDELKALSKEYFGYYDDLPKKDRLRAQQRYREWWESKGRARFAD